MRPFVFRSSKLLDLSAATGILLSAGTYLFDFGSNMAVLAKYGHYYTRYLHGRNCNARCRNQGTAAAWYFWAMVTNLIFSHMLNALIFMFKFKNRDEALRAAYFLPLIHLWRLVNLFWRTLSCKGVRELRSEEMNGLFNIVGTSFEGMPLLILQFSAYLVLRRDHLFIHSMSVVFKVSVAASLLSAAYSGGSSVQAVAENARTIKQKLEVALAAGVFTLFATLARCLTYTNIIVRMLAYFERNRSEKSRARFHATDTVTIVFVAVGVTLYWLFYWLLQFPKAVSKRLHDPKRCLGSFGFAYMSILVGPLYPMVSEAKDVGELGRSIFQRKLFMVAFINLLVDISVASLTYWMGTLPVPYLVTSSVAALGYLVSLRCYIRFDRACGPVLVSRSLNREEVIETTQELENPEESSDGLPGVCIPMALDNASDHNAVGTNGHFENEGNSKTDRLPVVDIPAVTDNVSDGLESSDGLPAVAGVCIPMALDNASDHNAVGTNAHFENEGNSKTDGLPVVDIPVVLDNVSDGFSLHEHNVVGSNAHNSENFEENVKEEEAQPLFDVQTESDQDANDFHGCGLCSKRSSRREDTGIEIQRSDGNLFANHEELRM